MILTIAHTKGGVGKSTTTWNILAQLRRQKKEFIVIDLDHQKTIFNLDTYIRQKEKFKVYTPSNISELHKLVTQHNDKLIIIDTAGTSEQLNKKAIQIADTIVTPIGNDSITEAIGFKKFQAILEEVGTPKINILFCNIYHSTKNFDDILEVVQDYPKTNILKTIIRHRSNYKTSLGQGLGVVELTPTKNKEENTRLEKSQTEIQNLVQELQI